MGATCKKCYTTFANEGELAIHNQHVDCIAELKASNKAYQQEFFRDM